MFTSWEQVESWIRDNNFAHWVFYKSNPAETGESKINNIIADSNFYTGDDADKIEMTKKYLLMNGGRAYGVGFKTPNTNQGGVVCDVRIEQEQPQQGASGISGYQSIGELRDSITREVRAQIKAEQYEAEKKQFEKDKAEFEAEKQTALGALVHYFAPIGQMMIEKHLMPRVAGVDSPDPVHAAPIVPKKPEQPQAQPQEEPFTDEEADQLMALMVRFKAVEPNYLKMIERVVEMAESGDATYTMAKNFLVK